ncbi:hypothetical protein K2173_021829 [Erythroxylum novogranatense]|uniref:DUF599 domain-containing protein n=1 Tax=Erythroxylum novogranatense TaxID=1862640 RepID=A0AAV8T206_9ROSI|nr:hypothetical protein K2173_021829 [Erythroxylum novogranatense]
MERRILDYTLVPVGMIMMVTYHLWLLYRIIKHPSKTVIGVNAVNRRFWVRAMMEDASKNGVLAVQTLRNNIMASTLLASTAIMLSSLIAVLMSNGSRERPALVFVYGDRSEFGVSMKFFSILVCFLLAFLLTVQSIRYYSHASILINVPLKKMSHHLTPEYVARSVNWGSYFWSLGLRAFYFSFPLFFWIFGPIPMFMCCFVLVSVLYFLDANLEFGISHDGDEDDHKDEELMIRN